MKWLYISRASYVVGIVAVLIGALVLDGARLVLLAVTACIFGGFMLAREFILLRKAEARNATPARSWDSIRVRDVDRASVSVPVVIDQTARQIEFITAQQRALADDVVQLFAIAKKNGGLVTRAQWRGRAERYGAALAFCKAHHVFRQEGRAHRLTMNGREFCEWLAAIVGGGGIEALPHLTDAAITRRGHPFQEEI